MDSVYLNRHFLCIDLKSFFAFCECVDKGLDPFKVPLVVANPTQGKGAITLAVSPYLKTKGVKSRTRLYEIPDNINYIIAKPRMSLYIKKSKEVIQVYLKYINYLDLHVYSIDECFLDVTDYLKLYQKTDYELALEILEDIKSSTGLYATCGIGPNMLLAKISMDIEAKHNKNGIAKWTYDDIPNKLWPITPLSNLWGIGIKMEKRLNQMNIYTIKDLAHTNRDLLKKHFGVLGVELWNHANGIDLSRIQDFEKRKKDLSYSHSQVLMKDYNQENIKLIIQEMVSVLTKRLRENKKNCQVIGFGIGYSKMLGRGFYHSVKLEQPTDQEKIIFSTCLMIFDKFYENLPIRKVTISCGHIQEKASLQLNLFESLEEIKEECTINQAIDEIKDRFGKNAILKASSLLEDSTIIDRNKKIGGHSA